MSQSGVFLGMGNPLLDISANVDQAFLDQYGVKLNDAILAEEKHQPIFKAMQAKEDVKYIAGGATQNTVRVCQWMLQTEGATSFMGCVGKDADGEKLAKAAASDGVNVVYDIDEKTPTGTCACLIKDQERSLVTNLAAANNYKKDHFESEAAQQVLKAAQFVYISGFFLTVSPPTIQAVGEHCAKENKVFAMNLSAPFLPQFFTEPMMAALPFVDFMFGNESEALAFAEKHEYADKSVQNVAKEIQKLAKTNDKRGRTVVITQGADATVVCTPDGKVTEYAVPKLAKEDIVDANGAGDAFVGGFMAALIQGKDMAACCSAGNYSASHILKVSGTVMPADKPKY